MQKQLCDALAFIDKHILIGSEGEILTVLMHIVCKRWIWSTRNDWHNLGIKDYISINCVSYAPNVL